MIEEDFIFYFEEENEVKDVVEYDWEKEWYFMYLIVEMFKVVLFGFIVFDRELVLFYDDKGELYCFEDWCFYRLDSFYFLVVIICCFVFVCVF